MVTLVTSLELEILTLLVAFMNGKVLVFPFVLNFNPVKREGLGGGSTGA